MKFKMPIAEFRKRLDSMSTNAGINAILGIIPFMSKKKLFGVRVFIEEDKTLTIQEREKLITALKKEYEKRKIEWIDL